MTDQLRRQIVDLLPRLRRFAYALTGDMDRGDDVIQEACVRALSHLHQWQAGTRLDSWMFRIAQNVWLDRIRAQRVRGQPMDIDEAHDIAGEDGRLITESRLALGDVVQAMTRLPAEQRAVIALVCVEGLSYKEAALVLEVPIGTIMSRLARGRLALYQATYGDDQAAPAPVTEKARGRSSR